VAFFHPFAAEEHPKMANAGHAPKEGLRFQAKLLMHGKFALAMILPWNAQYAKAKLDVCSGSG
jgi:hypothetical protein